MVGLGQNTAQLRVFVLDGAHGRVERLAHVLTFGEGQQVLELCLLGQEQNAGCRVLEAWIDH